MDAYMMPLMTKHIRTRKRWFDAWKVQISMLLTVLLLCALMAYHHQTFVLREQPYSKAKLHDGMHLNVFQAGSRPLAASSSASNLHTHSPAHQAVAVAAVLPGHSVCGNLSASQISQLIPSNLVYMQRRWEYTEEEWLLAIAWLREKEPDAVQQICSGAKQQRILLYFGSFIHDGLTGLDGSPQGEHIQWHDLFISLLLTGYTPVLLSERTSLTSDLLDKYDIVISDYTGVAHAMHRSVLERHRCKLRILDSYGTDQSYNMKSEGGPYCCLQLDLKQFWTFMPGFSPGNDFLGYTVPSFRRLEEAYPELYKGWLPSHPHRRNEVLLYGKEYDFLAGEHEYIQQLMQFAPTHATAKGWPQGALPGVHNHGVQSNAALHALMAQTFAYAGFPAVLMGPAAMEAISQGMIFLNYALDPPWNLSLRQDKPTTQLWSSQFPFLEPFEPHVVTINPRNKTHVTEQLSKVRRTYAKWYIEGAGKSQGVDSSKHVQGHVFLAKTRGQKPGFVPVEYTTVAMLQRVNQLMQWASCLGTGQ